MSSPIGDVQAVRIEPHGLEGLLGTDGAPQGLVIFAHGSGSGRHSPRNNYVATGLRQAGMATLLLDLLRPEEEDNRANVFDIPLLASRLLEATRWARRQARIAQLPVGYFGASTGAGAALVAAADPQAGVAAVVSRGGRPDLAGPALSRVRAPTLLLVGSLDTPVIALNKEALAQLNCEKELIIVPGATHLFEEPGTLEQVMTLAGSWFARHLTARLEKDDENDI
ncbi:MAG TPA: alpha/beta hydrolase [Noviherbaspirillum sp.]|nr:alpha/beta hydrolase [Noviherbaspirillum sp.]